MEILKQIGIHAAGTVLGILLLFLLLYLIGRRQQPGGCGCGCGGKCGGGQQAGAEDYVIDNIPVLG